jgi:hypothetical protein
VRRKIGRRVQKKVMESAGEIAKFPGMKPEHPTGLEIRFEREMAATIPGWKSDISAMEPPVQPAPLEEGQTQRYRPRAREMGGRINSKRARREARGQK